MGRRSTGDGGGRGGDDPSRLAAGNYERPVLETPNGASRVLMHSCCAPCAAEIMDALAASRIETTIFFYNPNIQRSNIPR